MRFALALLLIPTAAFAQASDPRVVAWKECVETTAPRFSPVSASIHEAVEIAFAACGSLERIYLITKPSWVDWFDFRQRVREHLLVLVAEERLKAR